MVDITRKDVTLRQAKACVIVRLSSQTLNAIQNNKIPKGDVFAVAKVAAIQAAKDTSRTLPLCHPIPLESVEVNFSICEAPISEIKIETKVCAAWKTGVEMEAMCAAMAAALTIYDMCKSLERGILIHGLRLMEKTGGKSGTWRFKEGPA